MMNGVVKAAIAHVIEYCERRKFDWEAVPYNDGKEKGYGYRFELDGKEITAVVMDKEYGPSEPVNIDFVIEVDFNYLVTIATYEIYHLTRNKPNKGDLRKHIKETVEAKRVI